jgi:hypothetical protein
MTGDGKKAPVRSYITELATGKRSVRFMIRMTLEERARLEDMARQAGLNVSALKRHLLTVGPHAAVPEETENGGQRRRSAVVGSRQMIAGEKRPQGVSIHY